jgi:hypothetical protein
MSSTVSEAIDNKGVITLSKSARIRFFIVERGVEWSPVHPQMGTARV